MKLLDVWPARLLTCSGAMPLAIHRATAVCLRSCGRSGARPALNKGESLFGHRPKGTGRRDAVWRRKSRERGVQLLEEAVTEVNRVVARATGNLTPAIEAPGQVPGPSLPGLAPRVLVRLMVPKPYVEVYDSDELRPRSSPCSTRLRTPQGVSHRPSGDDDDGLLADIIQAPGLRG